MQRLLIQQAIWDLGANGKFYQVTYEGLAHPGRPLTYDPNTAPVIPPTSVRTNELSGKFAIDKEYGQAHILRPTSWLFVLFLEWSNIEVDLSFFEQSLMQQIPFIDATLGYRSVELFLLSKDVQHPVQQDASTGTQAKFLFQAELGRA